MKPLSLAVISLTAVSLLASVNSCTSDQNPFDTSIAPAPETNVAKIRLALDVASTRAEDPLSTADERNITKVSVYVFDEHNQLEKSKTDITVSSTAPAELEVTPGEKTVYVVASRTMINSEIATGTLLVDFEKTVFDSTLDDLKTNLGSNNEFVMVGKSKKQQVLKSANENEVPTSNVFHIDMVRLLAKTQVKCAEELLSTDLGFSTALPKFCVSQTSNKMRLVADQSSDVHSSYNDDDEDGTYDEYTVCPDNTYKNAVTGDFTAGGCHYLTENIVQNPVAGNTTFVSFSVQIKPDNFYTYDEISKNLTAAVNEVGGRSFYAVAIVDEKYGFEDFALHPATHHVLTFETKDKADAYARALNGGTAPAVTVSESDAPLRAPGVETYDVHHGEFESVYFNQGLAYYRINIATGNGNLKVVRNKFYKIEVQSITNLGFHKESLLRPKEPTSDPGNSTSAWIETVLIVAPWDGVSQSANL